MTGNRQQTFAGMRYGTVALALLAVVLVVGMGIGRAWAYFTATDYAKGSVQVKIEPSTDVTETYDEIGKHVVIANDANAGAAAYVRARAFSSLPVTAVGEGWSQDGDWFVYDSMLAPGESTAELTVSITFPTTEEGAEAGENYNVVVVYESTPVQYGADGPYADWDITLDSGTAEGR